MVLRNYRRLIVNSIVFIVALYFSAKSLAVVATGAPRAVPGGPPPVAQIGIKLGDAPGWDGCLVAVAAIFALLVSGVTERAVRPERNLSEAFFRGEFHRDDIIEMALVLSGAPTLIRCLLRRIYRSEVDLERAARSPIARVYRSLPWNWFGPPSVDVIKQYDLRACERLAWFADGLRRTEGYLRYNLMSVTQRIPKGDLGRNLKHLVPEHSNDDPAW
jgi:hypothetical protein